MKLFKLFLLVVIFQLLTPDCFSQTIAAGGSHSLFVCGNNNANSCGANLYGQLGDGTNTDRNTSVQVSSLTGITAVAAGITHSLFLKNDGTVWACGRNIVGQLGVFTTDKNIAVQVSGVTGIVAVAAGGDHSLFLKNDGTVWACGNNLYGQLGDGSTTDRWTAVQVSGLTDIVAVAIEGVQSLFLKNDGTVWACGNNNFGQLGDGTTTNRSTAVQVSGLTGITAIAAGYWHSLFLKNDGTVWACGRNDYGQLGDGTNTTRNTAIQVSGVTGITSVEAGQNYSLFLKNDGTIWACGDNFWGQLGDGTNTNRNTAIQVSGVTGITAIAGGGRHSLFLKNDGTVWACGQNIVGQLGDGTTTDRWTAVQVFNLSLCAATCTTDTLIQNPIICQGDSIIVGTITYTTTGTFIDTLTNILGCDSIVTTNLTVNPSATGSDVIVSCTPITWIDNVTYTSSTNTPTFTIVGGAANGCDSIVTLNLTINANSSTDIITACDSLIWIDNVTYTSSTNTPTFTLTNINGCDSVVTLNLTISNLNASYTSIDNGGGNYTFTNTSTGSFTQTHWAFGDGTTSTLANPTHTFNANGTYVVVLTINDSTTNNTCTNYYLDTLVVTGVVNPVPCAAGFVMYPDGNGNLVLVNSSTGNNLTYFWDFGDGDTSTMQFPSHTYATTGPFYLCLTVNDVASCVDTYCDSIGINGVLFNKQTGFTINVIAPPVVVGVDEQGALITDVTIYPNPTTNEFVVELTNFSPSTQINIISVEGKMVYTNSSINTNKINVDAANWSRGIYIVKITDKQSSKVVKLVKQ